MTSAQRRFAVILNENAGRVRHAPEATRDAVARMFREHGIDARVDVHAPDAIDAALAEAHHDGVDAIVLGGGDGTLAHAARELCNDEMPLGILPMGTFNLLARDLRLPANPENAVAALAEAEVRAVDVGIVNGHTFLRHASLGIHPWVVRRRDEKHPRTRYGRALSTVTTALKALRHSPSFELTLVHDGRQSQRRCRALAVTVGSIEEGFGPAWRRAAPNAGYFAIYAARAEGRPLGTLWRSFHGGSVRDETIDVWQATQLDVTARHSPLPVALDGDVIGLEMPLRFRILPSALRVLVPRDAPSSAA